VEERYACIEDVICLFEQYTPNKVLTNDVNSLRALRLDFDTYLQKMQQAADEILPLLAAELVAEFP
jgi:hypothetical protein